MTAENISGVAPSPSLARASMRPRPMTAENGRIDSRTAAGHCGFNEAAADDRGKLDQAARRIELRAASMRPRPMTAENG